MTTPTTGAAELPEALQLAEILEGDYSPSTQGVNHDQ